MCIGMDNLPTDKLSKAHVRCRVVVSVVWVTLWISPAAAQKSAGPIG